MVTKAVYDQIISQIDTSKQDIKKRVLKNGDGEIAVLYISQLTDNTILSEETIKPMALYIIEHNNAQINTQQIFDTILFNADLIVESKEDQILDYILNGMTVILLSSDGNYIVVNNKKVEKRSTSNPELTFTLRGSRDSFIENIDHNLSLIRYRIKDPTLVVDFLEVGRRSKTRTAILYISDIANDDSVQELTNRIANLDVDGVVDAGIIQNLIQNKGLNLFPHTAVIERSDMAAAALLEGKIIVLVDGSTLALNAPMTFAQFFESCDDRYDNKFIGIFMKFIRMMATFLSISITPLYIAILSYHVDTLPADFILIISKFGQGNPFSVFVGALLLELIIELLREAWLRVPKQIGSAVGIVGGIVIGSAAIEANIFSPLLLIVGAISLLASFTAPDYTIANPLKILKFFLMFLSGSFGLLGFVCGISIILVNLVSTSSFGVPYLAAFAPFNWTDFKSTFLTSKFMSPKRPNFLMTKDNTSADDGKPKE